MGSTQFFAVPSASLVVVVEWIGLVVEPCDPCNSVGDVAAVSADVWCGVEDGVPPHAPSRALERMLNPMTSPTFEMGSFI